MIRHDPAKLAAALAAYDAKVKAALDDIQVQIDALQQRKAEVLHAIHASHKTFADGLIFSATARCKCGAGLCYEEGKAGIDGEWICSICVLAERRGDSMDGWDKHAHQSFPFREWEIKSETQPSAMGATTRATPVEFAS